MHDLDAVLDDAIEKQIVSNWVIAQLRCNVRPRGSDMWVVGEELG